MPCYRDQQQLDKDIVPKLLPSIAGHCCFQDKETSLIQRGPTRLASASPSGSNGDDRCQWRKQGGAVGAAASRMQAVAQQTLGAATRAVSPKVTGRARMLTIKYKRSDSIPPTKSLPIATRCPFRNGLALSGAYAPALPEGEPFGNGSQSDKFIKHKIQRG